MDDGFWDKQVEVPADVELPHASQVSHMFFSLLVVHKDGSRGEAVGGPVKVRWPGSQGEVVGTCVWLAFLHADHGRWSWWSSVEPGCCYMINLLLWRALLA